ncbi:chemotaxis protein CheW [Telmatospirillum sp. J64-1]|uniref:chemotaxis protein CheW n=1 Tax=Telmatospirillum sp. J64-1 TaxID=2502183 RepID=UPI00115F1913|nr:chemotaxis protein CheW [Telmatospirillum sp. J64-1]
MAEDAERAYLEFQLSDRVCALPADSVREIVPMADLARPPGMPATLQGMLDLGGQAIPVLRLALLLGLREVPPTLSTVIIVLREPLALMADEARALRRLPLSVWKPAEAENSFNGCADGFLSAPNGGIHRLDPRRLLLEAERHRIESLREQEQARLALLDVQAP